VCTGSERQWGARQENPVGLGPQPPRAASTFSHTLLAFAPLASPQRAHGCAALPLPPALPAGPGTPVPDTQMPRQRHPPPASCPGAGSSHCVPCPGSPPAPAASRCLLHPPAWLEPQPVRSRSKPKPPQQRSSYLLLEKGGNTVFDNYCFFHLTGCKLVNFFL